MTNAESLIRTISDTALWAAMYRASENDRPDAIFRDPFAKRLAGSRGQEIATSMPFSERQTWAAGSPRTHVVDQFITQQLAEGVDMVVNLAAGLDARPYRMDLPASLKWVEVDLPELPLTRNPYLENEVPRCGLERESPLDFSHRTWPPRPSQASTSIDQFSRQGKQSANHQRRDTCLSLRAEEVIALAQDLRLPASFLKLLGHRPCIAGAAADPPAAICNQSSTKPAQQLRFGPPKEGPLFFVPHRWKPIEVRTLLKTAASLNRLSFWMRLVAKLPESTGEQGSRPWGGVCLLARD